MSQYGYTIRRIITAPGEPVDPCAPLEFLPPKGSDELHEALKLAFPFEPTLQARMRQAVINFHLSEAQNDMTQAEFAQDEYLPSPQSSFVSTVASPTTSVLSRQATSASRGGSKLPAQEELMDVWCLPSQPAAKIHTRRNMTVEEKKAYKAKRLAGACADCKRRRRKCDHDPSNSTGPSSKKVVKTRKRSSVVKGSEARACAAPSSSFAVSPVAQASFTFTSQDNFFTFDTNFNNSMVSDLSFSVGFDDSFGKDFGSELKNDFYLFPDTAGNTGPLSAGMDAGSWLTESSPDTPLLDTQLETLSRDFNKWLMEPMEPLQAHNMTNGPPTPQSLSPQSLMMSRSQSGHSSSSNSLTSMLGNTEVMQSNQPASTQDVADFVLDSPQSLLASQHASPRSSQHASISTTLLSQQLVPKWSPQEMLELPTASFQTRSPRGSSSSSHRRPVVSWVGKGLLSDVSTNRVSDLTNWECSDQYPSSTASSNDSLNSAFSPSRPRTGRSSQFCLVSSIQDERARLRSTDHGRTLPPDLGTADGDAPKRPSTRMLLESTTSAPDQEPHAQVQPLASFGQDARIRDTSSFDVSVAGHSRRRAMRTTARAVSSEYLQSPGVEVVQSFSPTGQAGCAKNADRAASAHNKSSKASPRAEAHSIASIYQQPPRVQNGRVYSNLQAAEIEISDRNASGAGDSRGKTTKAMASGHSSLAYIQPALPSVSTSQTNYLENPDHHSDMSKLCRIQHSSAAADDVCSALQSSFDLPPLDGLALGSTVPNANMFQWLLLFTFAAMRLFNVAPSFSFGFDKKLKSKKYPGVVADGDSLTNLKIVLTRSMTRDVSAWQRSHNRSIENLQRALQQCSCSWRQFSGVTRRSACWLGKEVAKMQSKASRVC